MNSLARLDRDHFSLAGKRVWVAGHRGMVGSALVRRLEREPCEILTVARHQLDLTRQTETEDWMTEARPDVIIVAAAKVGGIAANSAYPADFLYINTMIAMNIMKAAAGLGTERLLWLGSSCIYPKFAIQPINEDALLTGILEPTNEAYAIAKIAAIKLAAAYARQHGVCSLSIMPTNIYGRNDNFDPETSHVIPAMVRKMHEARLSGQSNVVIWGTGHPLREFLHVDDMADAAIFLLKGKPQDGVVNVGSGLEISIYNLAHLVADIVGFRGDVTFDVSRPDGAPRKLLNCARLTAMGWSPRIDLRRGISDLYDSWLQAKTVVNQQA